MKLRPFRTSLVRLSLRRRSLTAIWVLIALAPVLALTAETARVTAAATAAESRQISKVRWALRLDPGNPAIHRQLGMLSYLAAVSLASPEKIPTDQIIEPLRKALQLNPYKPTYWCDLATVCDALHREDCAGPAFERALELDPLRPRFHWALANYELRAGQTDRALTHFQQLLALDSAYAPETFHICVHVLGDPQVVWDRILPRENDELKLAYMNVLMQEGQANAAFQVWNRIAGGPSRFSFSAARPFLDELINRRLF